MSRSSVAEPPATARRSQSWGDLAEKVPIRREVFFAVGVGISSVVFYYTTLRPPGMLVWVNYASGFTASLLIGFFLATLISLGERGRWVVAAIFAVVTIGVWSQFDYYHDTWSNPEGDRYADWTHRWTGKIAHRTLSLKNHVHAEMTGPMGGEPPVPHGRWTEVTKDKKSKREVLFKYGKRISQGDWGAHKTQ